jgi:hypothetical protein
MEGMLPEAAVTARWRWQRAAAAGMPVLVLVVLVLGLQVVMTQPNVLGSACVLLAVAIVALAASAQWMCREMFLPRAMRRLGAAALVAVVVGWLWERVAFVLLVPGRQLLYGYFVTAPGHAARVCVMVAPFFTVGAALAVTLCAAVAVGWRRDARWSVPSITIWWLTLFYAFALPTAYLWAQGDAGIFI